MPSSPSKCTLMGPLLASNLQFLKKAMLSLNSSSLWTYRLFVGLLLKWMRDMKSCISEAGFFSLLGSSLCWEGSSPDDGRTWQTDWLSELTDGDRVTEIKNKKLKTQYDVVMAQFHWMTGAAPGFSRRGGPSSPAWVPNSPTKSVIVHIVYGKA